MSNLQAHFELEILSRRVELKDGGAGVRVCVLITSQQESLANTGLVL